MNSWSKRLLFAVAALTAVSAWLTSIAFATSDTSSPQSSIASYASAQKMLPGTAVPRSAAPAFAQAAAPAGRAAQAPAPAGRAGTAPAPARGQVAPAAAPKPGTSDAVFKNIQVLKGLPLDEF